MTKDSTKWYAVQNPKYKNGGLCERFQKKILMVRLHKNNNTKYHATFFKNKNQKRMVA